jgi:hypothetical protein
VYAAAEADPLGVAFGDEVAGVGCVEASPFVVGDGPAGVDADGKQAEVNAMTRNGTRMRTRARGLTFASVSQRVEPKTMESQLGKGRTLTGNTH